MKELKATTRQILEKAEHYEWSLQGFGMLSLYLTKETRLNVWSNSYTAPNVSDIHDHPWNFRSTIVAGELRNYRFKPVENGASQFLTRRTLYSSGGCVMSEPSETRLYECAREVYFEGDDYYQCVSEIHRSEPRDGTVTVITCALLDDPDHTNVFWRPGKEWVSAEPRPATPEEVKAISKNALRLWF